MIKYIGIGLIEIVPHSLEVDALHKAVLIDCTTQWCLINVSALGEFSERRIGEVKLIDALHVVTISPRVGFHHATQEFGLIFSGLSQETAGNHNQHKA
jgi:hypothetical protein